VAAQILVPFHGEGHGEDELSWGQRELWNAMCRQRSSLAVGGAQRLPDGTTVDLVAANLGYIMGRHQSLRTRLRFDGTGAEPRQVVSASGVAVLAVVEADGEDPAEVAAELDARYHDTVFDYAGEWPVRMAVVLAGGAPSHVVVRYCHIAIDGEGVAAMLADLAARPDGPVAGREPLEQARWQRSPAGQRQSQASLRYWETLLRTVSPRRFGDSPDRRTPRHWELDYRSPAAYQAASVVAERVGTDTSPVLLAAFAVALARLTAITPVVTQVIVGNRFRPGLAAPVCTVNHPGLCVIDVADASFDEVVRRAWRSTIGAYKHAYYDPRQRDELVARIGRERGAELDLSCYFNDRRTTARPAGATGDATPGPAELRWAAPRDIPIEHLFLHVNDVPDTVALTAVADTHHVSPGQLEQLVRTMEQVLVDAAGTRAARGPVRPVAAAPAR
jgi:hypothetical protein